MKKEYGKPDAKFVKFNVRDIVVASGPDVEQGGLTMETSTIDSIEECE